MQGSHRIPLSKGASAPPVSVGVSERAGIPSWVPVLWTSVVLLLLLDAFAWNGAYRALEEAGRDEFAAHADCLRLVRRHFGPGVAVAVVPGSQTARRAAADGSWTVMGRLSVAGDPPVGQAVYRCRTGLPELALRLDLP